MKKINLGLIGFGTVGAGVVKAIKRRAGYFKRSLGLDISFKWICDKELNSDRGVKVSRDILTNDISTVLNDNDVDIIVELIGGVHPAKEIVLSALKSGKNVVTANKALLSEYGSSIYETAAKNGVDIFFEASVGGAIPIIKALREGFLSNRIEAIYGIVNGTSNYILSQMSLLGCSFKEALCEAQEKGYAEANPALDINGGDPAHKIAILAFLAFGMEVKPSRIYTEGITHISAGDIKYADESGYVIKLLAVAKRDKEELDIRVHPTLVPKKNLLASVNGVNNAVYVKGDLMGESLLYGEGAGQLAAASAVVSDIADVARNIVFQCPQRLPGVVQQSGVMKLKKLEDIVTRFYLRFSAIDCPGVLAQITSILGSCNISISNVLQQERRAKGAVPVMMMTHEVREKDIRQALARIDKLKAVRGRSIAIRIEE